MTKIAVCASDAEISVQGIPSVGVYVTPNVPDGFTVVGESGEPSQDVLCASGFKCATFLRKIVDAHADTPILMVTTDTVSLPQVLNMLSLNNMNLA